MRESGKMTKPTGTEYLCISKLERNMRAIGSRICSMAQG